MDATPYEVAEEFFSELYFGKHHIPSKIIAYGNGWCINHHGDLSTFDFDILTRLVFLAHDKCIRVELSQGGPRAVKISIWKRYGRIGRIDQRHPTIETALETWRKNHPHT
ncbi:hypothetical protein ES703_54490 [subsurface metagenome]